MLCNINLKLVISFIIYIEGSTSIFIIYMGIIRPLSHFDCKNFKASLFIKIINFNQNFKTTHLAYVCHIPCECDYLSKI
jgi:hypothetical protein